MTAGKDKLKVEFDEVIFSSPHLPSVENPVSAKIFVVLVALFFLLGAAFLLRLAFLQIVHGQSFAKRAEANYLRSQVEESERGLIYDRNGEIIAGNSFQNGKLARTYPDEGFLHILGFLRKDYPSEQRLGKGASGLEALYDDVLGGAPKRTIEEVDNQGIVLGAGVLENGKRGKNLLTSIDKGLQLELGKRLAETAISRNFRGGAGVFMNVRTGEILALGSVPDFNPNLFVRGIEKETLAGLAEHPGKPFFNRALSGLYPPGSIVKPVLAIAALNENLINPSQEIFSAGFISIPNQYDPLRPNIFPDWKAHGWVDMRKAIAVSSNVYFYAIGGGYEKQKGLGAEKINRYLKLFGFGERTGVDLPGEEIGYLPRPFLGRNDRPWSIGDTYNLSIGQGDILVTPIQMSVYASALASYGRIPHPHIVTGISEEATDAVEKFNYPPREALPLKQDFFQIVREGMRNAVLFGTAQGLSGFTFGVAAKTGTAEIGDTDRSHSWSIGFFPYDDPKIAFAVVMESGPRDNLVGATYVVSEVLRWIESVGFLSRLDGGIIN